MPQDSKVFPETARSLDYLRLYFRIMDRMGIQLDHFGDADRRLAGF